jgi:hypothetical protein
MKKIVAVLFNFFVFAVIAFSEVPNEIGYNGRLKAYRIPVDGNLKINFKIYDAPNGGTTIWESGPQEVKLTSGIFSYRLEPDEIKVDWRKKDLWLQLVVEGKELSPREKFTAQSYALHSKAAENLCSNEEIKVTISSEVTYIGIKNKKMYYKSAQDEGKQYFGVPPGTVIAFAGDTIPEGYLLCDGRELDISKYPDLFDAIGSIYGPTGTGKFKIPNFKGMFLRGTGEPAAKLGEKQGDAIRDITGLIGTDVCGNNGVFRYTDGAFERIGDTNKHVPINTDHWRGNSKEVVFRASRVVPTAEENRPINYSVNYCIKY